MHRFFFFMLLLLCINCKEEAYENPVRNKVIGKYVGYVNYLAPIPGDDPIESVTFTIVKQGLNEIKITTTFDLVLPITDTFVSDGGNQIITFAMDENIEQKVRGGTLRCGGSIWNNWGHMCGFYNITLKKFVVSFSWSDGTVDAGGYIFADRVD